MLNPPRQPPSPNARERLLVILQTRSFKRGAFTLASGAKSRVYFNLKTTMLHPEGARACAEALIDVLAPLTFDYMSGLEMGAVPLLGAVAALSVDGPRPMPATFVRKTPKAHGTRLAVEGLDEHGGEALAGKTVVLLEDVATSGGSILKAAQAVRAEGGIVTDAVVVVDREQGAKDALAAEGITLHALATAHDLGVTEEDLQPLE